MNLTTAQRAALEILASGDGRGYSSTKTDPGSRTIASGTLRTLEDRGLVEVRYYAHRQLTPGYFVLSAAGRETAVDLGLDPFEVVS